MKVLGQIVTYRLEYAAETMLMVYLACRSAIVEHSQSFRTIFQVVSSQIYFTGFQALPLISMLALASGTVTILQSSTQLSLLGGAEMIGKLLVILVVRELAPLMTALVVIARSGTAMASEVGNMRANREIEALQSLGINPLSFIVFPRVLGGVISVVCLSIYFVIIALFGGFMLSKIVHGLPLSFFLDSLTQAMAAEDLALFLIKNTMSGLIIFSVCCYQGLLVGRSPTEVPVVTTQAVVKSILAVVIFNLSVSILFYLNQLARLGVI